jgi:hypothetical protein
MIVTTFQGLYLTQMAYLKWLIQSGYPIIILKYFD